MTLQSAGAANRAGLEVRRFTGGPFAQNGYLVTCTATDRVVVVDPGATADQMIRTIETEGWTVEAVYLTHAHIDHIEGLPGIRESTDAPIHLHPADRVIYDSALNRALSFGITLSNPLPPPDREIFPGEDLPVGEGRLEVRFAPGHSPGHVILVAPEEGFALVGDVIFRGSIGRTDLPGGDSQQLMRSIREQVLTLSDDTILLSGHGPETRVHDERVGNPFLISQSPGSFA